MNLSLSTIHEAAQTLRQHLPFSPLLSVDNWATRCGTPILIKAECLMPTGSFKIRGATFRISKLSAEERLRGVIAYSTGNHAQAVAKAAAAVDVTAVIVMSPDVPLAKVEATRAWGADVVMAEASSDARRALAERLAIERGLVLIPPYDDCMIMAGQASIAVELMEQLKERPPSVLFVPVGGGGLLAGVAAAIKQMRPSIKVIGVEPALEQDACRSFREGKLISMASPSNSIADAIKVQSLGHLTFPLIRQYVDDMIAVNESDIATACLRYFREGHLVVEPGGAVALAAAFQYEATTQDNAPAVVLACGGNITLERLWQLQCEVGSTS